MSASTTAADMPSLSRTTCPTEYPRASSNPKTNRPFPCSWSASAAFQIHLNPVSVGSQCAPWLAAISPSNGVDTTLDSTMGGGPDGLGALRRM